MQAGIGLFGPTTHLMKGIHSKEDILAWARSNDWQKLEVLKSTDNTVEFKAYF
jgi:SEC-C motif-containing protein